MIGGHIRDGDYQFRRQQSESMREAPWEHRLPPLASYTLQAMKLLSLAIGACLLLVALLAVSP